MVKEYVLRNSMLNELFMADYEEVEDVIKDFPNYVLEENRNEFEIQYQAVKENYKKKIAELDNYVEEQNCLIEDQKEFKLDMARDEAKIALVNLIKRYFNQDCYKELASNNFAEEVKKCTSSNLTKYDLYIKLGIIRNHLAPFLSTVGFYARRKGYFLSMDDMVSINRDYNKAIRKFNERFNEETISNLPYADLFYRPSCINETKCKGFIDLDEKSIVNLLFSYFNKNIPELCHIADIVHRWIVGKRNYDSIHADMNSKERDDKYRKEELYGRVESYINKCEELGLIGG